jgi:hypothetical protein
MSANPERWLPVSFSFGSKDISIRWLDFGTKLLSEPFFSQTVRQLKRHSPAARERVTGSETLIKIASKCIAQTPAGIIFHVSRCGSTMIANALKLGVGCAVLSEASAIGSLFSDVLDDSVHLRSTERDERVTMLVNSVVRLYSASFGPQIIIKTHAANILHIARFRTVWPSVPFLIVIRDPIEVLMSNLANPSGWLSSMCNPTTGPNLFGLMPSQVQTMSVEQYASFGLGRFLEAASANFDENCWIVDYKVLNSSTVKMIFDLFDIRIPEIKLSALDRSLAIYSKDPLTERAFRFDSEDKQLRASSSLRQLAMCWTDRPYLDLQKRKSLSTRGVGSKESLVI